MATTYEVGFSREEVGLALRNPGMPLEALRYPITPIGMHYVLIHFDVPLIDPERYRLTVGDGFSSPFSLSLNDLRSRPAVTTPIVMECAGSGRAHLKPRPVSAPWHDEAIGCAEWTGTPLGPILEEAGIERNACEVLFSAHDRGIDQGEEQDYERSLPIGDALSDGPMLAYAMNGQPLPPTHGAPLRLVVPGWYGMASVKWLRAITAIEAPFDGVQQARLYRYRRSDGELGEPVTRKRPRAVMVPPGIPEFLSRRRHLKAAPTTLEGRAWSGSAAIERVEVSVDGGSSWREAELERSAGPHAWVGWSVSWHPEAPGDYDVCARATDGDGETQPLHADEAWNLGGYGVNVVQRVPVRVG